jgi:uncharacterized protein (TIGR02246 family)
MKHTLLSVLALCTLLTVAPASPKPPQKATRTAQELTALLNQFAEALRQSDVAALEKLLAPDYLEISPVGEVDPRAKVISFYQPQAQTAPAPDSITVDEVQVRSYGELAVVVARQTFKRQINGQSRDVAVRVTYICRQQKGRWQFVSAHYTGIRPAPVKPPAP